MIAYGWNEYLENGGNFGEIARVFLKSDKYQLPMAKQIEALYKAVPGRDADTVGHELWVEPVLVGAKLDLASSSFINCIELTSRFSQQTDREFISS